MSLLLALTSAGGGTVNGTVEGANSATAAGAVAGVQSYAGLVANAQSATLLSAIGAAEAPQTIGGVGPNVPVSVLVARQQTEQRRRAAEKARRDAAEAARQEEQAADQPESQNLALPETVQAQPIEVDRFDVRQIADAAIAAARAIPDPDTIMGRVLIQAADEQAALMQRQRDGQKAENRRRAQMLMALLEVWR
jgi:hypothetical protein